MKWIQCFVICMSLISVHVFAQGNIQWHNGMTFEPSKAISLADFKISELAFGKYYRLFQFDHNLSEAEKHSMNEQGIEFLEYIPDHFYMVSIDPVINRTRVQFSGFIASFELSKNYKLSKQLLYGDPCIQDGNKFRFVIKYMKGIAINQIKEVLSQQKIATDRLFPQNQIFYAKLDMQQLDRIASLACIQFIDCESATGVPEDREGRSMHRVNLISSNPKENLSLSGKGVKVMVRDDGFVGPHIDFQGRIHQDVVGDFGNHGDGVSGVLTGAGNFDPVVEGMAPGAELYTLDYQPDFLDKTLYYHTNEGVVITNSSYSNGCNVGYTIEAQVVDKQIFENPTLIHVFSAGNFNGSDCGYGAGTEWGNVTGGHKIAKNALTVANLKLDGTLDYSSSRGPTKDGRLKPEISARGTDELSTDSDNTFQVFGGTSAASPGVAGVCALLYEGYKNLHNGQNPESALIKAAIMNTATDIGTPGPDYQYGFGVIDAYKAYHLIAENRYQKHSIQQGDLQQYLINVPSGILLAKFMIYWSEPEASLLAGKALINNLDMIVIDPNGNEHKTWLLNPTPNPITLAAGATLGVDTLNNFEQVSISTPVPGLYTIRINGTFLPSNKVDFYLLNEIENKSIRLTSPVGGEKFSSNEYTQVYYTNYGSDSIKISFSPDAGLHWQEIGIDSAGSRLHSFFIPNNVSSDSCLIEVTQGNAKDRSGFFTITKKVQDFRINRFCPNEIELSWKRSSKDSFQIYKLGEKYMEPVKLTNDTMVRLAIKDPRIRDWFSIAGYDKTILSKRELAISTPDTLIGCGITKDLALSNSISNPAEYYSCGNLQLTPNLKVINRTKQIQSGFTIKALSKNKIIQQYYSLSINPYDTIEVAFDSVIIVEKFGPQIIKAWLEYNQDQNPFNDTVFIPVNIIELPEKNGVYPMLESFVADTIPQGWIQKNDAFDSRWNVYNVKDKNGLDGNALLFTSGNSNYNSFPITLVSKTADLTNAIQPYLYFDFVLHHIATNIYFDSLRIRVKQVCGSGYKEKVLLSGISSELNTVDTTSNKNWWPNDTAWFSMAYDLSEFKGSKIVVEYEIVRGIGDRTFLDNVQIREKITGTENADFNINPNPACYTKLVTFNDSSAINGKRYIWDLSAKTNARYFTGKGPFTVKFNSTGIARVILKIKSDQNNDAIIVKELSLSGTGVANYTYKIENDRTVKFTNTSVNAMSYLWDFGDGTFSTEINPIHKYDSAKIYRVKLSITNFCGTYTRSINLDLIFTSIENTDADTFIDIFPNPTHDELNIKSKEPINSIGIYNAEGKLILQQAKLNTFQIDISFKGFAAGIYMLNIGTINRSIYRKLQKE